MPVTPAARSGHPLWTSLNQEWQFLTTSATAHSELLRWHRLHPQLTVAPTLAALKPAIDSDPTLLNTLVDLYQRGSELAAKALVYAMLGKLVRLSHHARIRSGGIDHDNAERAAITVAAFLDTARHQNIHAPRIAGSLALKTLTAIQRDTAPTHEVPLDVDVADHFALDPRLTPEPSPHQQARGIVDDALADGHITRDDHQLLCHVYLTDDTTQAALADQMGITYAALRRRTSRAVARLRTATTAA